MVSQVQRNSSRSSNPNPSSIAAPAALQRAEACLKAKQWSQAIVFAKRAIELEPSANAYKLLGNAHLHQQQWQAAQAAYRQALELQADSAEIHANLGTVAAQQQDWAEALQSFRRAIALKPKLPQLQQNLERLWVDMARSEAAVQLFLDQPQQFGAIDHQTLGDRLMQQEQVERAIQCYEHAVAIDPALATAWWNLSLAQKQLGNQEAMLRAFAQAVALQPDWATAEQHCNLGKYYLEQEQWEAAIVAYQRAIERDSKLAEAHLGLGLGLQKQGKLEEAIERYRRAIELEPKGWLAYHNLGGAFLEQKRWAQALEAYERAIELNPEYSWAHHNLGDVLKNLGRWEAAAAAYRKAIALNSEFHWSYYSLGEALIKLGNLDGAMEAYQEMINLDTGRALGYQKLADVVRLRAKIDLEKSLELYWKAIEHDSTNLQNYHKALELQPNDARLHIALSNALEQQGQFESASVFRQLAQGHKFSNSQVLNSQVVQKENEQAFDWKFYTTFHDDLGYLLDHDSAYRHWVEAGYDEGRPGSISEWFQKLGVKEEDLPKNFDYNEYLELNPDLKKAYKDNKYAAIDHYLRYGREEGRLYSLDQFYFSGKRLEALAVVDRIQSNRLTTKRIAIFVHIYYPEIWPELKAYIRNISEHPHDLFISIVESVWTPEIHTQIREVFYDCKILITKNKGRDIGGYISLMGQIQWEEYDVFCLIHTKKSPHLEQSYANQWRKDLLNALLGSKERVQFNLNLLRGNHSIGVVGSQRWRSTEIHQNANRYFQLLNEFEIKPEARMCEYVAGTMMMMKPSVFRPIFEKFHTLSEFQETENSPEFLLDGQLEHAIERLIGNLVRDQNMQFYWQD